MPSLCSTLLLSAFLHASAPERSPPLLIHDVPAARAEDVSESLPACDVELELEISAEGAVSQARVLQGCHPALDAAALKAAFQLRFAAATERGRPVEAHLVRHYAFAPGGVPGLGLAPARLSGQIRERGTRRPLPGALLFVDDAQTPVEAGPDGRFSLPLEPGPHRLRVRAAGHLERVFLESVASADSVEVLYGLDSSGGHPFETVVRKERERIEVARTSLAGPEVHELPGTQGDPLRAVMLLPGVTSVASGLSYPAVRGTQPAATGFFLDGIPIPQLYHLLAGPAVFSPDFIEGFDFFPGLPPVGDGRKMGGAIEATAAKPHEDRLRGSAYADLINAGAFVETPIGSAGPHVTLAGRVSYTPLALSLAMNLLEPNLQSKPVADFWDYQARVEQRFGEGSLRLLAFGSSDVLGAVPREPDGMGGKVSASFHRVDLRYRGPVFGGEGELGATWGVESMGMEGVVGTDPVGGLVTSKTDLRLRASWTRALSEHWELSAGADAERALSTTDLHATTLLTGVESREATQFLEPRTLGVFAGAYAQVVGRYGGLTVTPGVRVDSYHATPGIQWWSADPRVSARLALSPALVVKAGAGLVHQAPSLLLELPMTDVAALGAGLQSGAQTDVGLEWQPLPGLELRADAFYNPSFRTVEYDLTQLISNARRGPEFAQVPAEPGRAYGVELLVRKQLSERWFGWISYTWSRSERLATFSRDDDTGTAVETVQGWVPFAFDETHVVNAALSVRLPWDVTVGATVHCNTGRPESGQITSRAMRPGADPTVAFPGHGDAVWIPVDLDRSPRLPSFFRVDARVSKTWTYDAFLFELYLDVLNASGSSETVGYVYREGTDGTADELTRKPVNLPIIVPMLGLKWSF